MDEDVNEVKGTNAQSENNLIDKDTDKDHDKTPVVKTKNNIQNDCQLENIKSDGNHNNVSSNPKELVKNSPKKTPAPRIIANNFKTTKPSKSATMETVNGKNVVESSPENTSTTENCDATTPECVKTEDRNRDIQGLRLKSSKELLNQTDKITSEKQLESQSIVNNTKSVINVSEGERNEMHLKPQIEDFENKEQVGITSVREKINRLRVIRPKLGSGTVYRRSISGDSSATKLSDIGVKGKVKHDGKDVEVVEPNKSNNFWEHRLLNYLSPRLNHPRSHTTNSKPISSKESSTGKNFGSCPIWIHLLVSKNILRPIMYLLAFI